MNNNILQTLCILTLLVILPALALADTVKILSNTPQKLTAEVTTDYLMGDGDSLVTAHNMALETAKRLAAEKAGSYVESELVIENDAVLRERVMTFSAALLSVDILAETTTVTASGRPLKHMTIRATLDKQELQQRVAQLKKRPELQQQVNRLQKNNIKLQQELARLTTDIQRLRANPAKGDMKSKPRPELGKRRDEVLTDLAINQEALRQVFARGSLANLAQQSDGRLKEAKQALRTHVFEYLANNIKVTLGQPDFRPAGNGLYDLHVTVTWAVDTDPVREVLLDYFELGGNSFWRKSDLYLSRHRNNGNEAKQAISEELFHFVRKHEVAVEISVGRHHATTVLAGRVQDTFHTDDYAFVLNNQEADTFGHKENNPVIITGLTASELENVTAIEKRVVVR